MNSLDEYSTAKQAIGTSSHCYHCGAPVGKAPLIDQDKAFCCSGCVTVFHILHENGLSDFYRIGPQQGARPEGKGKYAWLDDAHAAEGLLDYNSDELARVHFKLPDMHCAACIWLLEHLYKIQNGISRSEVDFPRREITLNYNPSVISLRQVVELLDVLGYPPQLSLADTEDAKPHRTDRRKWFALGLAGFCFGNIMLLSFPEYLGISNPRFAAGFQWLNLGLTLPVLYSARHWFKSAWAGLRHRNINMDLPIALGIAVLFIRSTFDIVSGAGPGYFDSLAGLVFFLLIGRIYQDKTYHLLSFDRDYRSYFPISITRIEGEREVQAPIGSLSPGDHILVRNGELIPADGHLLSEQARLDYSFVTGESDPVPAVRGERIYAGARQVGPPIELLMEKAVAQGYLAKLWNHEAFRKQDAPQVTRLSNQIARYFTPLVLLIAAAAGIWWAFTDSSQIWNVVTAVLIIACPCALALSTPFALGNVMRLLGRRGMYLKSHTVIEQMAEVDSLIFDKTGTITHSEASGVLWEGEELSTAEIQAVRATLRASIHPLSRRIHGALPIGDLPELEDLVEEKGKGLMGRAGGMDLCLGSAKWVGMEKGENESAGHSTVHVRINGRVKGKFAIRQSVRSGVGQMMRDLGQRFRLGLLSGDHGHAHADMVKLLPPGSPLLFHQSPEEKLAFVKEMQENGQRVAMVGDGLNDAGALGQSDLGIAVTDELAAFTPASDAILKSSFLSHLPHFLRLSRAGMRLIYASFLISLLYNLIGLFFAVQGELSPLIAAVLMPASSISVVLFTTLGATLLGRRILPTPIDSP